MGGGLAAPEDAKYRVGVCPAVYPPCAPPHLQARAHSTVTADRSKWKHPQVYVSTNGQAEWSAAPWAATQPSCHLPALG